MDTTSTFKTGWRKVEDPRDDNHLMASVLGSVGEFGGVVYRYHVPGLILNQENTNSCVGYTIKQWKQTSPIRNVGGLSGLEIYRRALQIDEFLGEQDTGTSIRAGLKVEEEQGTVERYVWARSAEEIRQWILFWSSVVVGTQLYQGMQNPTKRINVGGGSDKGLYMNPTGQSLGGHAYLLTGFSASRWAFRVCNSWGTGWAEKGKAWIRFDDLDRLIKDGGDAVGIIERRV